MIMVSALVQRPQEVVVEADRDDLRRAVAHGLAAAPPEPGNVVAAFSLIGPALDVLVCDRGAFDRLHGINRNTKIEAGKGVAVVAQEVRELAQKSATAARDIGALITSSAADVENGVALVLKTGESLELIQDNVQSINEHIGAIVGSSRDQSARLGEISSAVNGLDQVTQQNAAMVEETSASAHSLAAEAEVLNEQISHFSVSSETAGSSRYAA